MNLSGCDAVVYLKEQKVNDLLAGIILCFGSHLRVSAVTPELIVGSTALSAKGTLRLAEARVICLQRPDNAIGVQLTGFARVSGSFGDSVFVNLALKLSVTADVPVNWTSTSAVDLSPFLDVSAFSIVQASIAALDDTIPDELRTAIVSPEYTDALANELRKLAGDKLKIAVPSVQILGAYVTLIEASQVIPPFLLPVGVRVLNGCLAIAWGVLGVSNPNPIGLVELPWPEYDAAANALSVIEPGQNPRRSNEVDVVVALDSAFLATFASRQVSLFMRLRATSATFTVTQANCHIQNSRVFFDLRAKQDALTASADVHLTFGALIIGTPVGRRPVIRDLGIDIDLGLFDSILAGLAHFFWGVSSPEELIRDALVSPTVLPLVDLTYRGILPQMPPLDPGVPVPSDFARRGLEFSAVFAAALFQPTTSFGSAEFFVMPPAVGLAINATNRMPLSARYINFVAEHPDLMRDPSLWLVWRVLNGQGIPVWTNEGWAETNFGPKTIDLFVEPAVQALSVVMLECLVFRGRTQELVMSAKRGVIIDDKLDRSRPYTRRSRGIGWDEEQVIGGQVVKVRRSKPRRGAIHKTRFPGRCRFAASWTSEAQWVEYLEDLPDPIGTTIPPDANGFPSGRRLCPYCFKSGA